MSELIERPIDTLESRVGCLGDQIRHVQCTVAGLKGDVAGICMGMDQTLTALGTFCGTISGNLAQNAEVHMVVLRAITELAERIKKIEEHLGSASSGGTL